MSHPLNEILHPAQPSPNLARELQDLKEALSPFLGEDKPEVLPGTIPMRIEYSKKPSDGDARN